MKNKAKKTSKNNQKEKLFNIPNALSISRLILGFILVYLILFTSNYLIILLIFTLAALTDFFDGYLARKLKQTTKIGARLDQYIDRIFMIPLLIILVIKLYNQNPKMAYLSILCLTREIIGAPGVIIRVLKKTDTYKVKFIGKVVTFIQSFAVGAIILTVALPNIILFRTFAWLLAIATGIIGIIAGFDYLKDSLK
ncbi:MAG TPA: CDP-alcohol phosphatidyltransferase family protein [Candidatus Paceibacterota bacterium]|nr:CDP-alcohol phosphatidyltransferase family protein [Candidatus Paceibacterota bacterium]